MAAGSKVAAGEQLASCWPAEQPSELMSEQMSKLLGVQLERPLGAGSAQLDQNLKVSIINNK